ncbi:MAG: ribosome silencing factor [Bacteroidetes bacterium]|nr:ribosome silencing factor [Bacteroidota bacterium]
MFEKKAEDVVVADLEGLTSVTDYFVICTATSDMHAKAIADHVEDQLHLEGARVHHKEGYQSLKWVLLDYVDVIAHVFQRDARVFYDLENLWGDARFESLEDVG